MKVWCVLLGLLVVCASAEEVITLTSSNFDSFIQDDISLVEFYAPWCGHCKKLAPEYEKAAKELRKNDPAVRLGKVDATEQSELASRFGVSGYPTMKIFRNGVASEYNGPREARGIISYMQKQSGPASKNLESLAAAEKFLSQNDVTVLGLFANTESEEYKIYSRLANKLREKFKFAESNVPAVMDKFGFRKGVLVFKPERFVSKYDQRYMSIVKFSSESQLEDFIWANCLPLVGEINEDNHERYEKASLPIVTTYYKVDYEKDPKGTNYYANRLRRVAADFVGRMLFVIADKKEAGRQLESFGISDSENFPVTVRDGSKKYRFQNLVEKTKVNEEALKNFLHDVLAGKVEPYLKSGVPPADNSGPVKVVTAKTFDEIVNQEDKDVLIEFYAPWCGHCKKLTPIWDSLGEKFKDSDRVVIAKMDATENDVPSPFNVRGFPTIYFSPAGMKAAPRTYEGGRELNDFISYLKRETGVSVSDSAASGSADGTSKKKKKRTKKEDF
eukprot:GILJ01003991.1.p1 GENE.GILJ01003991.1~~GILJ01003991.1.p1  ORF type:complete len:515 (-),score=94.14 GILJ01003991.1:103-1608(-)